MSDQITDLQVMYFSEKTQQWQRVDKIVTQPGADPRYRAGATPGTTQNPRRRKRKGRKPIKVAKKQRDLVNEEITNVERLRLAAGGHSIDVIPMRRFKDAADAVEFSKRWIQKRREHFIILKGETVGIETLRARQIHEVTGLGKRLSGNYYFTSFRHKFAGGSQYRCEFIAHKVLEDD
jgi:phage protein D